METSTQQSRRGRDGWGNDPGNRTTRRGRVPGGDRSCAAGRTISSFTGEAAIHTESRRKAAAVGDTDGTGPSGADGDEVGDLADLRSGLPEVQLWIPPEAKRDRGAGSDSSSGQPGPQLCRGCRHSSVL